MGNGDIGKEQLARAEDELMHGLIEEAKRGDKDAARNLLWQFYCHVECGEPVPPHILRYLAGCFRSILDEEIPAAQALYIEGIAYRSKAQDTEVRDKAIAQMVLMRANNDHHQGALERAKDWVVEETGFPPSHIDEVYETYRKELAAFYGEYGGWPVIMRPPKK